MFSEKHNKNFLLYILYTFLSQQARIFTMKTFLFFQKKHFHYNENALIHFFLVFDDFLHIFYNSTFTTKESKIVPAPTNKYGKKFNFSFNLLSFLLSTYSVKFLNSLSGLPDNFVPIVLTE